MNVASLSLAAQFPNRGGNVELTLTLQSIDRRNDMTTSDPKNEPKTPKADQAQIHDLPESRGLRGS